MSTLNLTCGVEGSVYGVLEQEVYHFAAERTLRALEDLLKDSRVDFLGVERTAEKARELLAAFRRISVQDKLGAAAALLEARELFRGALDGGGVRGCELALRLTALGEIFEPVYQETERISSRYDEARKEVPFRHLLDRLKGFLPSIVGEDKDRENDEKAE